MRGAVSTHVELAGEAQTWETRSRTTTKPAWLKKALVRYRDCLASHSSRLRKLSFQLMVAANFLLPTALVIGGGGGGMVVAVEVDCATAEYERAERRAMREAMRDMCWI